MIAKNRSEDRIAKKMIRQGVTVALVSLSICFFAGCMKPAANAQQDDALSADLPPAVCNEQPASKDSVPAPACETETETRTTEAAPPPPPRDKPAADATITVAEAASENPPRIISPKRFSRVRYPASFSMDEASIFNAQVHDIAVQLIENLNADSGLQGLVGVSTFVDLNYLYRTSPLGRYLAEQLMGELQRAGFQVVEIRKTDAVLIKQKYGEYSLSREISEISNHTAANIILVGTYMVKGNYVFINARLVSTEDGMVASSAMKIMPNDRFMRKMLWPSGAPEMNRKTVTIPIKSFGDPTEVRIIQGS